MMKSRPVQIPPWISYPLSGLMISMSILTFTGFSSGDGMDWPVLTTFRNSENMLHVINNNHVTIPAWFYRGAKGVPSILWVILIPMQHNQNLRKQQPKFHRLVGYFVLLLSLELVLSGYWMLYQGWAMSHENPFHLHSLRGFPLVKWPTFAGSSIIISVFYNYSLFRTYSAIKSGFIESHRRWAVFHTMTGYSISLQRLFLLVVNALGWMLHATPDSIKHHWFGLSGDTDQVFEVELSAFAWTVAAAIVTTGGWAYYEWSKAGLVLKSNVPVTVGPKESTTMIEKRRVVSG